METFTCPGFQASGLASGLKPTGDRDLGLIYSETVSSAAGVFTTNKVQAGCVTVNRERLTSGRGQAVIVNSGNANCCTGDRGREDTLKMAACAGREMGISEELVLVASTGVIGEPLEIEKIEAAAPRLAAALSFTGLPDFAEAIRTTGSRNRRSQP